MPNGPSKQELEMYWQNSRQYFDELAAHYKKADPQYYKEYIEPFYTNPFAAASSGGKQKTGGGKAAILIVAVLVLMFGVVAAAGLIFYFGSQDSGTKEKDKYTKQVEEELKKDENIRKELEKEGLKLEEDVKKKNEEHSTEDPSELSPEDNFIIGSKYISEKKYDKAEYHLKKIKKGDKYYEQAQQLLENMSLLRKYNK
jgi:hypothetical protein